MITTVIQSKKRLAIDWSELYAYRELFYYFAWRDIKVRYKQTAIGASWAIFQPFITMVVFTLFFNHVAGIKSNGVPYAIFSYTGLLFWNYFSEGLTLSSGSLLGNQTVITKIYFPRIIAPIASSMVALADFGFALIVFIGLMAYYHIVPGLLGLALFIPAILVSFVAATGLGFFLSALNVKYRDVKQALPFFIQTGLFLTPVIYPITQIPARFQWVLYLNPMTGVITTMRAGLLHQGTIPWVDLGLSVGVSFVALILGLYYFKSREREFADII